MLIITFENIFYILMLLFSVVGMMVGLFKVFPSLKNSKFLKSFFE